MVVLLGVGLLLSSHAQGTSIISGHMYQDLNRNSRQDSGEAVFANQTIYIFDNTGAYLGATNSDASGYYSFTGLSDGTYKVVIAPVSWQLLRMNWLPSTSDGSQGSLSPNHIVSLTGSADVSFPLRPIKWSTDPKAPLASETEPNGMVIATYNDVVTPSLLYQTLQKGTLYGKEAQFATLRFGLESYGGDTTSAYTTTNGVSTNFSASSYVTYASWLNNDGQLFHEYGHAWSLYYDTIVQQDDGNMTGYLKARGLYGDTRVNSTYAWNAKEMIADDYRILFGTPSAAGYAHLNTDIPQPQDVPGLKAYLAGAFMAVPTDTAPPSAPTALVSTKNWPNEIDLGWGASTDNVGVLKYNVYRNGVLTGFVNSPTVVFAGTNLTAATTYAFSVRAVDAAGNVSASSNVLSVTTPPLDTQPPTAPSGLKAASQTSTSLVLSWTASSDNFGVAGYRIYQVGGSRNAAYSTLVATTNTTSHTSIGLAPATSYSYYVVATDAAGNQSLPSNTATAKTLHK